MSYRSFRRELLTLAETCARDAAKARFEFAMIAWSAVAVALWLATAFLLSGWNDLVYLAMAALMACIAVLAFWARGFFSHRFLKQREACLNDIRHIADIARAWGDES